MKTLEITYFLQVKSNPLEASMAEEISREDFYTRIKDFLEIETIDPLPIEVDWLEENSLRLYFMEDNR